MKIPEMPHLKHDEHLCYLENTGYLVSYLNDYKELVKNASVLFLKFVEQIAVDSHLMYKGDDDANRTADS